MENFTIQDYAKLLKFYKDKASDIELQYLSLQINHTKDLEEKVAEAISKTRKSLEQELSDAHTRVKTLEQNLLKYAKKENNVKAQKKKK